MSDLISRRDAIDAIQNQAIHTPEELNDIGIAYYEGLHYAFQVISMLPSAEPERKTGKWLSQVGGGYRCSKCGRDALHDVGEKFALLFTKSKYCPHCGAKMEDD